MKSRKFLRSWNGRGLYVLVAGTVLTVPSMSLAAQPEGTSETIFVGEWSALSDFLVDDKDQGIVRALGMVRSRVRELPAEIPEMPILAASLINTVLEKVSRPARVAVVADPENPSGGAMGFGLIVSLEVTDEDDANGLHAFVSGILEQTDVPFERVDSQRFTGMQDIQLPAGLLSFGPRRGDSGWRYEMIFGSVENADAPFEAIIKNPVAGLETVMTGRLDLGGLEPAFKMVQAMAGNSPQAAMIFGNFEQIGFVGDDALRVEFQTGYTKEAALTVTTVEGARTVADALSLPIESLSKSDYAAIPGDATMAWLSRANLSQINKTLEQMAASGVPIEMVFEMFRQQTGVDLRADILSNCGGTVAVYLSESTGGGGLGSAIFLSSLADKARFVAAVEKIAALGNAFAGQGTRGYVRIDKWNDGDIELFSVRFPGLPVPFELTCAFADKWLVAGVTPQAVIVAARQAIGQGDSGLRGNAAFAKAVPNDKNVVMVSFVDNETMMARGYPLVSLLGSALANAVRSPTDASRDPGLVVPTYPELIRDVRPQVKFAYWQGDDYVSEAWADRSGIVNAAGLGGIATVFAPVALIPAIAIGIAQEQGWSLNEQLFDEAMSVVDLRQRLNPLPGAQGAAIMLLAAPEWFEVSQFKELSGQSWFTLQSPLSFEADAAR